MNKALLFASVITMVFSTNSFGGSSKGKVTALVIESGVVQFKAGSHSGKPSCCSACGSSGSNSWGDWSFQLDSPDGKAKLALLLYARSNDLEVAVNGTKNCSSWGDRETAKIFRLVQ